MAGYKYQRIDIVFDRYTTKAIKGGTRSQRTQLARPIRRPVECRDVPFPNNWTNFLSFPDNKADLAHSLSEELCIQTPDDKEIVFAGDSEMNLQ